MEKTIPANALQRADKVFWYEIKKVLGQGSFGITYLALDTKLSQDVAIKEYLPRELAVRAHDGSIQPVCESSNEEFLAGLKRFINEAHMLTRFDHPNIVWSSCVFELNNTAYMVMRYEKGTSLRDIMKRREVWQEDELLDILLPILDGLQEVHEAGFIHRDIKPSNILIREDGSPVLLDFGSARQMLDGQIPASIVSPGYAPFEQYDSRRDQQGPWTDIYGLGATTYRAVSGMSPISAVERALAIQRVFRDPFITANEMGMGRYTGRFLDAIDHALRFKPQHRPQNIAEWKRELETLHKFYNIPYKVFERRQLTGPGSVLSLDNKKIDKANLANPTILTRGPVWTVLKGCALGIFIVALPTWFYWHALQESQKPDSLLAKGWGELGTVQFTGQNGDIAQEKFLAALELAPDDKEAHPGIQAITDTYLTLATEAINAGDFDDAEMHLAMVAQISPNGEKIQQVRRTLSNKKTALGQETTTESHRIKAIQAAYDSGDYEEAFRLLKALAEQGHARAQAKLGYLYGTGRGVGQDDDKAVEWYRKAAQQGDADAQNNLAVMYENARDYREAVKWYRKLAEQGHAPAQARLGYLYGTGRGVAQDHLEALRWFRKAAEHGHAVAQNNLGIFYREGLGVDSNYAEAAKWFRKAAAQGHDDAQYNLALIYELRADDL